MYISKKVVFILSLISFFSNSSAQEKHHSHYNHEHPSDSTDVFFRHMKMNEVVVTGVTGDTKMKYSTAPVSVVSGKELRQTASTNIIDAIAHQPGVAQITTGGNISKPIIRGLGYNRIVVMSDGVRQEGQQWGDEHGLEVDAYNVNSVEILKGPASLMYGADAMAGVLILHSAPTQAEGEMKSSASTQYQTNNGLFDFSLSNAGNLNGFVWDARYTDKRAHAYKNKYDDYVPGSQFKERAGRLMLGLNKRWGQSHIIWSTIHQTPSIIEGERNDDGSLTSHQASLTTYDKALPFQQIKHYKAVWDNSINLPHGWLKAIVGYQQNQRQEFEEDENEYELFFKLHTVTYDVRYLSQQFNGWKVTGGMAGMWQQSLNLGEETLIPEYKLFDIGAFAMTSKTLGDITVNGGLRYDTRNLRSDLSLLNATATVPDASPSGQHLTFHGLTGSIGAVWNASPSTNVRMNIARGFRAPNISELGCDGVHEGTQRYEVGNASLKAEYSWQADLGIDVNTTCLSAQASLFANRIGNYIFAQRIDEIREEGYQTYQYTQGDARLLGFEAGVDFHPIHSLHFANTFAYVDARQMHVEEDARHLPMTPAPRWASELKYEITHHGHAALNNAFVSMELECYLAQNNYYKVDNTETRTPAYGLLNISAGTDLNIKRKKIAELYIAVDNLLDKAYQNHLSRLKYCDINNATGRQGVYNMGRNVIFKIVIPIETKI